MQNDDQSSCFWRQPLESNTRRLEHVLSGTEVLTEGTGIEIDFDELVLQNHQMVRMFLARFVHCPQRVDDLAQETFVTAFKQLYRFEGRSKPSTWLVGIARNKAIEFIRNEQRRNERVRKFVDSNLGLLRLQESTVDSLANETSERLEGLKHCLGKLPAHSFELVEQFYFDEVSAVAIAAATEARESTIRMKLKRIRDVLQKCIRSRLQK